MGLDIVVVNWPVENTEYTPVDQASYADIAWLALQLGPINAQGAPGFRGSVYDPIVSLATGRRGALWQARQPVAGHEQIIPPAEIPELTDRLRAYEQRFTERFGSGESAITWAHAVELNGGSIDGEWMTADTWEDVRIAELGIIAALGERTAARDDAFFAYY